MSYKDPYTSVLDIFTTKSHRMSNKTISKSISFFNTPQYYFPDINKFIRFFFFASSFFDKYNIRYISISYTSLVVLFPKSFMLLKIFHLSTLKNSIFLRGLENYLVYNIVIVIKTKHYELNKSFVSVQSMTRPSMKLTRCLIQEHWTNTYTQTHTRTAQKKYHFP